MSLAHPLRPLVLALSLRLNYPRDLLMEIEGLPASDAKEASLLSAAARQAALELARAAVAFNWSNDVAVHAARDEFRQDMMNVGVPLMCVGTMPWPDTLEGNCFEAEWKFRRACLDVATGCFALTSRVPRPDRPNLITNIMKAIPMGMRHGDWTFYTLPDYGGAPVEAS